MIQFINVNKNYDDKHVLEDISFKIEEGSIVGLVGRNGSGKSTILRLLAGVLDADAGIVAINEESVFDNPNIKKEVFFVSDDLYFLTKSTIKDMMQFYQLFYPNFDLNVYYELLKVFGFNESQAISSFSKGMKRQVALILGISTRTKILLLDEAFDGLDPFMRFKVRQLISDSSSSNKTITIISSHNLSELSEICDSILMIDEKKLHSHYNENTYASLYHRFRLAFKDVMDASVFDSLNPLHINGNQRIFTLVIKGDREEILQKLQALEPILLENDTLTLDEIFIYEMEAHNERPM